MVTTIFKLQGIQVDPPNNWRDAEIEISNENDQPSATLRSTEFEFHGLACDMINAYRKAGLTGGPGIYEGMDYEMTFCTAAGNLTFKGCLDTAAENAEFCCDIVKCPIRQSGKVDFVHDVADGFRFAYLASLNPTDAGKISTFDYIPVPYVISAIPDYEQLMILAISVFIMAKEVAEIVRDIEYLIAEAAPPTTLNAIVKIAFYLIYLGIMVIALIKLVKDLVDNIIQVKKVKYGMKVKDLFQKACDYLGLSFSSTILQQAPYDNLVIIPRKNTIPGHRNVDDLDPANTKAYGYYDGTFGDLIRDMCKVFNAKIKVFGTTLEFERFDHWQIPSSYKLPDLDLRCFLTNAHELPANLFLEYALDPSELNTFDEYDGTTWQVMTTPINIANPKNLLLKGLVPVSLSFSLGKRKETLTIVETVLNDIINAIFGIANAITTVINAILTLVGSSFTIPPLPTNILNNRIGWLKLSSDFTGNPKLIVVDANNYLDINNKFLTAASTIGINYYLASTALGGAQRLVWKDKVIHLCCADFIYLLDRNYITDYTGTKTIQLTSCLWRPATESAKINFRSKENFTNNLQSQTIIDGAA